MKHRYTLFFFLIILISSCGVQKRLYRPGFYFPDHSNIRSEETDQKDTTAISSADESDDISPEDTTTKSVASNEIPATYSPAEIVWKEKTTVITPAKAIFRSTIQNCSALTSASHSIQKKDHRDSEFWDEDTWTAIGFGMFILGIVVLGIGALVKLANPIIGEGLTCAGCIVALVGCLVLGVANPELLFQGIIKGLVECLANCA